MEDGEPAALHHTLDRFRSVPPSVVKSFGYPIRAAAVSWDPVASPCMGESVSGDIKKNSPVRK
jgi:hypothetical protein